MAWYKLARWRALRPRIFLRDLYTCQHRACGSIEPNAALLVCDHVIPHRGDERLFWDEGNLQNAKRATTASSRPRASEPTHARRLGLRTGAFPSQVPLRGPARLTLTGFSMAEVLGLFGDPVPSDWDSVAGRSMSRRSKAGTASIC